MKASRGFSNHRRWLLVFGLWLTLLSGGFTGFLGTPGILQAVRLKNLLEAKHETLFAMQQDLAKTQNEALLLQTNRAAQVREIRRVLGYAAPDELIFDFKSPDQF